MSPVAILDWERNKCSGVWSMTIAYNTGLEYGLLKIEPIRVLEFKPQTYVVGIKCQ